MKEHRTYPQWRLLVSVFHGPGFGHYIEIETWSKAGQPVRTGGGTWNSMGIPESVLTELRTLVDAKITEHLVTRYGIQGELPIAWAGEPDPF
jgi:hypothetical protein